MKIAVFDLDRTLIRGDSLHHFLAFMVREYPGSLVRGWHLPLAYAAHKLGARDNEWLKTTFLFALFGRMQRQTLLESSARFAKQLLPQVRPAAVEQLKEHRKLGHYTVLATASPDFYVEPLTSFVEFDEVICTKSRWSRHGTFDGLDGGNCYGEQKFQRVEEARARLGDAALSAMYTDHRSDEALLAAAEAAYLVNPDRRTEQSVVFEGLQILDWDRVT
ncbi:MAG: HAD-IB family hydrolase [Pseudomonadota bacterium]